jgi:hypothetical protein
MANGEKMTQISSICFFLLSLQENVTFLLGKLVKKSPIVTMFNLTKMPLNLVFFTIVFLTNNSLANLTINFD